ncbi:uncharacterized protein LOC135846185 [Planococcus citri]|uniref:uncharacterized protein LOC135846185 n=1 Tax=Planococcus citri TaxID=170843 RepID=UPI0031FA1AA6
MERDQINGSNDQGGEQGDQSGEQSQPLNGETSRNNVQNGTEDSPPLSNELVFTILTDFRDELASIKAEFESMKDNLKNMPSSTENRDRHTRSFLKFNTPTSGSVLTKNTNYDLWKSRFLFELKAQGAQYLLDKLIKQKKTKDEREADEAAALRALIDRLDETHHRMIQGENTVEAALQKLDSNRAPKGVLTTTTLWEQLYSIKYRVGEETAPEFMVRFENLVKQIDDAVVNTPGSATTEKETVTDIEKKRILMLAIGTSSQHLQTREAAKQMLNDGKGMTFLEMKTYFLSDEQQNNTLKEKETHSDAAFAFSQRQQGAGGGKMKNDRFHWTKSDQNAKNRASPNSNQNSNCLCTNCGMRGHQRHNCKNGEKKWCYNCFRLTDHISVSCPHKNKRAVTVNSKSAPPPPKNPKLRPILKKKSEVKGQANLVGAETVNVGEEEYYLFYVDDQEKEPDVESHWD